MKKLALILVLFLLLPTVSGAATTAELVDFVAAGINDTSGTALNAGLVYFYVVGTSTLKTVYTSSTKGTEADNPTVLNANGAGTVFADGTYKIVVTNSGGTVQYTYDNVAFGNVTGFTDNFKNQTATLLTDIEDPYMLAGLNKGLWMMDGTTTTMQDESWNDNDCTLVGGLTLASDQSTKGTGYTLAFDGVGDYGNLGDDNDFSFGDGSNDNEFTIFFVVNIVDDSSNPCIVSKYDVTTGANAREWLCSKNSAEQILFSIYDESANVFARVTTTSGLSAGWRFIAITYDGAGGATAAGGMAIYVDGVSVSVNATNNASYVAMENLTTPAWIGAFEGVGGTPSNYFNNSLGCVGIVKAELNGNGIWKLWKLCEGLYEL